MRPILGDFLAAASGHIDAAIGDPRVGAEAAASGVRGLGRLISVMARCADAFVRDDQSDSRQLLGAQELAMLDARSALRYAAARTRAAWGALGDGSDEAPRVAVAFLSAADSLTAGHDLLQTHFTTDQSGWRYGNSPWAPAIVSQEVNAALITEIGSYAGRLAPWALHLAAATPEERLPPQARAAISTACRWLWVAEAATKVVGRGPDVSAAHALLHAIPINVAPPRYSPRSGEPVPEICAGTVAAAERLRHVAHIAATHDCPPHAALAVSWQRTAQAAAITGHCGDLILHQLAEPAARLPLTATAETAIKQAAEATSKAWQAWRAVAHAWDTFTTSRGTTFTPVAAEISDLALWTGRLAHTDPAWTPARNHASPIRPAAAFASSGHTTTAVVTALHHVSDALARIAGHDRESVRSAAANDGLYIPTRLLPAEDDVPYRYVPALPAMLDELLASYDAVAEAASRAATTLDHLALTLNPRPTILTSLRAVTPLKTLVLPHAPAVPAARPAKRPAPGRVEQALRDGGISEPALLARAAGIDDAARALISSATSIAQRRATANPAALQGPESSPAYPQHPAQVAARDSPPTTGPATSLPRLVPIGHQIRHNMPARRRPSR